ncbi:hypothetical protein MRB53_041864 [Persea americana]|nr:hypothetical protein MRB53_041864 [Persea americana]
MRSLEPRRALQEIEGTPWNVPASACVLAVSGSDLRVVNSHTFPHESLEHIVYTHDRPRSYTPQDCRMVNYFLLGSQIPIAFKTALYHQLSWSETADKWDLSTAIQVHFPAPEDDVRQALFKVIKELLPTPDVDFIKPELAPVFGEWVGHRAVGGGVRGLSETQKYQELIKETTSEVTIFHAHGGGFLIGSPGSHRPTAETLARLTGGRTFSIDYRLAPQHPFPAAILDCLVAYLSILFPPPGSLHSAVKAENIVFKGDSAGANLVLAVLQFLLHHNRNPPSKPLLFHGQALPHPIPMPCLMALNSLYGDVSRSLPSHTLNTKYDFLQPANDTRLLTHVSPCAIWPSSPPRADEYCATSMMNNQLVSPVVAPSEFWKGCPPVWICEGDEICGDDGRIVARNMARAGVDVRFEAWESMCHAFAGVLFASKAGERCFESLGSLITDTVTKHQPARSSAVFIRVKTYQEEELEFEELIGLEETEVVKLVRMASEEKERLFRERTKGNKGHDGDGVFSGEAGMA